MEHKTNLSCFFEKSQRRKQKTFRRFRYKPFSLKTQKLENIYFFLKTNANEVTNAVKKLKNGFSSGHDVNEKNIFNLTMHLISEALDNLFDGYCPKCYHTVYFKTAKILPLCKSRVPEEICNCSPI